MQEKSKRLVINNLAVNSELSSTSFFHSVQTTGNSAAKIILNKSEDKETQATKTYLEENTKNLSLLVRGKNSDQVTLNNPINQGKML
tara:strand:- start:385 stop:645 length:261 start_codon:yes stop_codon:yes gene_type:complete